MIVIQEQQLSEQTECSYIHGQELRFNYFFATRVSDMDLDLLLEKGWRKFGIYYFRPSCPGCRECIPLRIPVSEYHPTRSQKRTLKRAENVEMTVNPLVYRDEVFEIYRDHSLHRFGRDSDRAEFMASFYQQSCPGVQTEYYLDGRLFAVGYLDLSHRALSSVYFVYHHEYEFLSPGVLGVLREVDLCHRWGLDYYYLGYYIAGNRSMSYKNRFYPHELFDWEQDAWIRVNSRKQSVSN
jgi:arginine-tRNA-protein transferase